MGRRLAASDIHGEGRRLLEALTKVGYAPGVDRLFVLGDYVDRGSDPAGTVRIVQELVAGGAVALKGNHEAMAVDACRDAKEWALWVGWNGGAPTVKSYGGAPPPDVLEWLDNLPLYHEEPDCILVHAGLKPGVPLEAQSPNDLLWIRDEFLVGYLGKRVFSGHTPTRFLHEKWAPWHGPDKTVIDTGAAYGGRLTVMDIDTLEIWTA